jgi:hypothetical protein
MCTNTVHSPVTFGGKNLTRKRESKFLHNTWKTPSDIQTITGNICPTDKKVINMELKLIRRDIMDCIQVADNRTQTCILQISYIFTFSFIFHNTQKITTAKLCNSIDSYLSFIYVHKIKCQWEQLEETRTKVRIRTEIVFCAGWIDYCESHKLNPLNAELNPICHLLALLEGATIVDVSRLRVNK